MTTSSTKTKALCVATRCTSVEQFVATFHRFCGDDQTFFVATMTSRPVGLETAFSIQLADKQPVLRGMCIVLDAWETPENRYRRPGIRLGIKRLTADSQVVFDRLKAASRAPANVEATPPPGPAPSPPSASSPASSLGSAASPSPGGARRPGGPPPLPPLLAPRSTSAPTTAPRLPPVVAPAGDGKPALPRVVVPPLGTDAKRALPSVFVPPVAGSRATPPGGLPSATEARPPAPSAPAVEARTAPPGVPLAVPAPRPVPGAASIEARPAAQRAPAGPSPVPVQAAPAPPVGEPSPPAAPAPIEVTRFQLALHVDTIPPPVSDVEFKPQQLVPRRRAEPRILGEPPDEAPVDAARPAAIVDRAAAPAGPTAAAAAAIAERSGEPEAVQPAVLVDRRGEPMPEPRDTEQVAVPLGIASLDPDAAADRAPGSALVLPANPLQDLSDESIEGFVDCTLYEEIENIFHPGVEPDWVDTTAEPPAARATPQRATPPGTVPAMPFDEPPNLTVRALGGTESLALAPDDPSLSRTASGELGGGRPLAARSGEPGPRTASGELGGSASIEVAAAELAQSRTASGELWSETVRRAPEGVPARIAQRHDTPLPRPASNPGEPLGAGPDPASWFDNVSLPYSAGPGPGGPGPGPGPAAQYAMDPAMAYAMAPAIGSAMAHDLAAPPLGHADPGASGAMYSAVDSAQYPRYSAADLVALPVPPQIDLRPPWQRWLLIGGSVLVAIIFAFVVARLARGSARIGPAEISRATGASGSPGSPGSPVRAAPAPPRPAPPPAPPAPPPAPPAPPAPAQPAAPPRSARAAAPDRDPAAAAAAAADPAAADGADTVPDEDGEAATGSAPVVGSGPCRFTVATTPAGSIVRFDDQAMGPSPLTIEGSCDRHKVDVAHARYQSVTKWVTLAADQPQTLDINLPRPVHAVTVTSFPPGAELSIDGHRAGTTPTVIQVAGFATVNLTFTKPGFQTVTRKVYSKTPQDRVFVKLMK